MPALALLVAAGPAQAAVEHARDNQHGGYETTSETFNAVVDPGEGRYLLAAVVLENGAVVTDASYAGLPMGRIAAATSPGNRCRAEWWGLASPPVGEAPAVFNFSGKGGHLDTTLLAYQGVAGLDAFVATGGAGADGPIALTVGSAAGEVVLDVVCGWSLDGHVDDGGIEQTAHWHWSSGNMSSAISDHPGAPSVTMTWTDSGPATMEWAGVVVALRTAEHKAAVRLNVESTGCAAPGTPRGGAFVPLAFVVFFAIFAARRRAGTSAPQPRETTSHMRLHASRTAVAPAPAAEPELDGATLARAKAGDRRAQAAIVHRYERPVFALLWRMIGPQPAVVEDLTQETFLRVLRALDRFEDDGRARMVTWVLSIASRLAIDHLRACRPHRDVTIVPGALPVALPTPEHEVNRRALGAALIRAVDSLSPQFRAAFLLREVHGLTYDEIGLALEIDVGTVKSRLARARATLQAALAEMRDE